ncbi:hypothetical protein POX_f07528 [Penicillium oxalicum]|uniref:Uncharacterized protein n=1 Tax=Penicillium oxalicum (strain 114-2 / CGMCC 5302) TaxID=933388 RepID=S7ZDU1_PENO1|nr:hypothetical protein POX_f07528 [Penicillium oxalicum]EPS28444.1 hypothetical protein PDE_03390 [Penicillium oxalicum 114-2]KAI2787165.1 hypothetical protein POX_f07528 [Penicillium oxalicum]
MKFSSSTSTLLLRYTSDHVVPPVAQRYLGSPVHPIRPKIAYMYANRDPTTLWWRVSVSHLNQFKRTVRSWCARRARMAFQESLKRQGFDRLGRSTSSSTWSQKQPLLGSLELTLRPACLHQSFEALQKDTDFLLKGILKHRERSNDRNQNR